MHLHFERTVNAKSDCSILSLTWMGKVPDEIPEDEGWKLNRTNYYQEGWLATGNVRGIVGVTFTTSHCKRNVDFPLRTNYNLRGHRSEVILVKWNEPYQKLASCDSSGIIFVWIKYEGRWSIELINDRNTPVTHFSWSHDGRMALICYQDGFVLVGSVAGQRYWSSMLNLEATITCGIWTPDDQQVYFGTTSGQIIVMDVHGAMVSQIQLISEVGITSMAWSCEKFKMEEGDETTDPAQANSGESTSNSDRKFVLAVSLENGFLFILRTFDDLSPIQIDTGLQGTFCMEWSNSRELLAVAGVLVNHHHPHHNHSSSSSESSKSGPQHSYTNLLKFYNERGSLLQVTNIPYSQAPVSALTWGHNDKRLFLATGNYIHIAWISKRIATLQLLCRLKIHDSIQLEKQILGLPLPARIRNLIGNLFAQTIRCCVPETNSLREFVSRPPAGSVRLHCTMIRHDEENNLSAGACYTLYLEYLGGLVPLLKGKRTSKIRPEFVIFDPQTEDVPPSSSAKHKNSTSSSNPHYNFTNGTAALISDSSDSDLEEGCTSSPRMQRRRRRKKRDKFRPHHHHHVHHQAQDNRQSAQNSTTTTAAAAEGGEGGVGGPPDTEDLAYVDTLPEHVRLVEVTSNIWGTKFKIHGIASSVPANLGQVTYKTSLLHLQPRQMTLVMTELRDDFPVGPDPNFNPNLFSEDEDERHVDEKHRLARMSMIIDNSPPIAPIMSPRRNSKLNHINSNSKPNVKSQQQMNSVVSYGMTSAAGPGGHTNGGHHMMTESSNTTTGGHRNFNIVCNKKLDKEELLVMEPPMMVERSSGFCDFSSLRPQSLSNNHSNNSSVNNSGTTSTNYSTSVLRSSASNNAQCTSFVGQMNLRGSTPSSGAQRHAISPLCCEGSVPALQSPKNAVAPSDIIFDRPPAAQTLISYSNSDYLSGSNNVQQVKSGLLNDSSVRTTTATSGGHVSLTADNHQKTFFVKKFEVPEMLEANIKNKFNESAVTNSDKVGNSGSKIGNRLLGGTTATANAKTDVEAVPGPSTSPRSAADQMVRSCSVGYLDTVDGQLMPNDITLLLPRKDAPRRLVLVHKKSKAVRQTRKNQRVLKDISNSEDSQLSKLVYCGKSKSLDSSDLHRASDITNSFKNITHPMNQTIPEISSSQDNSATSSPITKKRETLATSNCTNGSTSNNKTEISKKKGLFSKSPLLRRRKPESEQQKNKNFNNCNGNNNNNQQQSGDQTSLQQNNSNSSATHSQALTNLEKLIAKLRDDDTVLAPAVSPRLPRSSPSSPTMLKKGKRPQSASPIRKSILSSPFLSRRSKKSKNLESSDDEVTASGDEMPSFNGSNYKDLETFQKAQLIQKLKRGKIEPNGTGGGAGGCCNNGHHGAPPQQRREFVMHNKAPMWNENSQVYQLDFGGRVTQESAKNFQIEFRGKQVMQFGRIDGNAYTLDFQYPFSALQAFAVALANVTQRLK